MHRCLVGTNPAKSCGIGKSFKAFRTIFVTWSHIGASTTACHGFLLICFSRDSSLGFCNFAPSEFSLACLREQKLDTGD